MTSSERQLLKQILEQILMQVWKKDGKLAYKTICVLGIISKQNKKQLISQTNWEMKKRKLTLFLHIVKPITCYNVIICWRA